METQIAGGILLALGWIAITYFAIRLGFWIINIGFGVIGFIFSSPLLLWSALGTLATVYYVTRNDLWATLGHWLGVGCITALLGGTAAWVAWLGLKELYTYLQWTERMWDKCLEWTRSRRAAPPRS